ncbi:hypothetical protein L1887_22258 [Cichorium endivia]|nr:hypothetical protein L1887_22258 [Cichorium endivia]
MFVPSPLLVSRFVPSRQLLARCSEIPVADRLSKLSRRLNSATRKNGTSGLLNHLIQSCRTSPLYKKADKKKQTTLRFKPKGTETEEDLEGSTRKRKRKARVVGASSGVDWETARYT